MYGRLCILETRSGHLSHAASSMVLGTGVQGPLLSHAQGLQQLPHTTIVVHHFANRSEHRTCSESLLMREGAENGAAHSAASVAAMSEVTCDLAAHSSDRNAWWTSRICFAWALCAGLTASLLDLCTTVIGE